MQVLTSLPPVWGNHPEGYAYAGTLLLWAQAAFSGTALLEMDVSLRGPPEARSLLLTARSREAGGREDRPLASALGGARHGSHSVEVPLGVLSPQLCALLEAACTVGSWCLVRAITNSVPRASNFINKVMALRLYVATCAPPAVHGALAAALHAGAVPSAEALARRLHLRTLATLAAAAGTLTLEPGSARAAVAGNYEAAAAINSNADDADDDARWDALVTPGWPTAGAAAQPAAARALVARMLRQRAQRENASLPPASADSVELLMAAADASYDDRDAATAAADDNAQAESPPDALQRGACVLASRDAGHVPLLSQALRATSTGHAMGVFAAAAARAPATTCVPAAYSTRSALVVVAREAMQQWLVAIPDAVVLDAPAPRAPAAAAAAAFPAPSRTLGVIDGELDGGGDDGDDTGASPPPPFAPSHQCGQSPRVCDLREGRVHIVPLDVFQASAATAESDAVVEAHKQLTVLDGAVRAATLRRGAHAVSLGWGGAGPLPPKRLVRAVLLHHVAPHQPHLRIPLGWVHWDTVVVDDLDALTAPAAQRLQATRFRWAWVTQHVRPAWAALRPSPSVTLKAAQFLGGVLCAPPLPFGGSRSAPLAARWHAALADASVCLPLDVLQPSPSVAMHPVAVRNLSALRQVAAAADAHGSARAAEEFALNRVVRMLDARADVQLSTSALEWGAPFACLGRHATLNDLAQRFRSRRYTWRRALLTLRMHYDDGAEDGTAGQRVARWRRLHPAALADGGALTPAEPTLQFAAAQLRRARDAHAALLAWEAAGRGSAPPREEESLMQAWVDDGDGGTHAAVPRADGGAQPAADALVVMPSLTSLLRRREGPVPAAAAPSAPAPPSAAVARVSLQPLLSTTCSGCPCLLPRVLLLCGHLCCTRCLDNFAWSAAETAAASRLRVDQRPRCHTCNATLVKLDCLDLDLDPDDTLPIDDSLVVPRRRAAAVAAAADSKRARADSDSAASDSGASPSEVAAAAKRVRTNDGAAVGVATGAAPAAAAPLDHQAGLSADADYAWHRTQADCGPTTRHCVAARVLQASVAHAGGTALVLVQQPAVRATRAALQALLGDDAWTVTAALADASRLAVAAGGKRLLVVTDSNTLYDACRAPRSSWGWPPFDVVVLGSPLVATTSTALSAVSSTLQHSGSARAYVLLNDWGGGGAARPNPHPLETLARTEARTMAEAAYLWRGVAVHGRTEAGGAVRETHSANDAAERVVDAAERYELPVITTWAM